jgi:hypothetical protein
MVEDAAGLFLVDEMEHDAAEDGDRVCIVATGETYPERHLQWDDRPVSAVSWLPAPEDHDFPAAASYLSLLADDDEIAHLLTAWRSATAVHFKAKDILRAARLDLLPTDNPHVASDLRKIRHDVALSPVLLVRGSLTSGGALQIADGYHRVCASYHTDENTDIPCLLAATTARR